MPKRIYARGLGGEVGKNKTPHRDFSQNVDKMVIDLLALYSKRSDSILFSEINKRLRIIPEMEIKRSLYRLCLQSKILQEGSEPDFSYRVVSLEDMYKLRHLECLSRSSDRVSIKVGKVTFVFARRSHGAIQILSRNPKDIRVSWDRYKSALHMAHLILEEEFSGGDNPSLQEFSNCKSSLCGFPKVDGSPCTRTVSQEDERCFQHTREARQKSATRVLRKVMERVRETERQMTLPF